MDNLDLLLRELQKAVEDKKLVYVNYQNSDYSDWHFKCYPVDIKYNTNGLCILGKNDLIIHIHNFDDYTISLDKNYNCLSFSLRDNKYKEYYNICF